MHVVCLPPTHGSFTYTQQTVYKYMPHAFKHIIHFIHCNIFGSPHKGIVATTYVLNPVHDIHATTIKEVTRSRGTKKNVKTQSQQNIPKLSNAIHLQKPVYLQCSHQGYMWHPLKDYRCKSLTTADFHPVKIFK